MELLIWSAFCALVGLGCLGGAAWAVLGGEDIGVERIFLVIVWLLFAGLFLGMAAWIAKLGALTSKKASTEAEQEKQTSTEKAAS